MHREVGKFGSNFGAKTFFILMHLSALNPVIADKYLSVA